MSTFLLSGSSSAWLSTILLLISILVIPVSTFHSIVLQQQTQQSSLLTFVNHRSSTGISKGRNNIPYVAQKYRRQFKYNFVSSSQKYYSFSQLFFDATVSLAVASDDQSLHNEVNSSQYQQQLSPKSQLRFESISKQTPLLPNQILPYTTTTNIQLPPWISRYYDSSSTIQKDDENLESNIDFLDDNIHIGSWSNDTGSSTSSAHGLLSERCVDKELKTFEFALVEQYGLSPIDVQDIVNTMVWSTTNATSASISSQYIITSNSDRNDVQKGLLLGLIDLLNLVVDNLSHETYSYTTTIKPSKEILLATIIHYIECTSAQFEGTTSIIKEVLFRRQDSIGLAIGGSQQQQHHHHHHHQHKLTPQINDNICELVDFGLCLPASVDTTQVEQDQISSLSNDWSDTVVVETIEDLQNAAQPVIVISPSMDDGKISLYHDIVTNPIDHDRISNSSSIDEVQTIVSNAARLKRAEILIQALASERDSSDNDHVVSALSSNEAKKIRGLLLTISDDWRALAIRCMACLFRLDEIIAEPTSSTIQLYHSSGVNEYQTLNNRRTPEIVRTAREALRVYATLAAQLGLHRLKSKIENRAFQILYRRQYTTVQQLYANGTEQHEYLQTAANLLQQQIEQVLSQDSVLMSQVESIHVHSRVKEPYSFWRKLLKTKHNKSNSQRELVGSSNITLPITTDCIVNSSSIIVHDTSSMTSSIETTTTATTSRQQYNQTFLSISDVHDTVAVRVVLKARKWRTDESRDITDTRDAILCYYVQKILMSAWPSTCDSRVKDYIQHPKQNGYRSLHYTGEYQFVLSNQRLSFPFEVQIRSERMHETAEFGGANHWDYKLNDFVNDPNAKTTFEEHSNLILHEDKPMDQVDSASACIDSASIDAFGMKDKNVSIVSNISHKKQQQQSYVDALNNIRQDIASHLVYVFTVTNRFNYLYDSHSDAAMSGKKQGASLLSFPVNSCVQDVLWTVCNVSETNATLTDVPTVLRNGRRAMMSDKVQNGDILIIQP